jgi:hypothetical protein
MSVPIDLAPAGENSTADEIIYRAHRYASSHNRIGLLLYDIDRSKLSTPDFWRVFHRIYPDCDDTWRSRTEVLALCRSHGIGTAYLEGECKEFFDALPESFTVYRGTQLGRVRGLSWTTDRLVAEGYAKGHRQIAVPNSAVYMAIAMKAHIFIVSTSRGESEVIVNPPRLRAVSLADAR